MVTVKKTNAFDSMHITTDNVTGMSENTLEGHRTALAPYLATLRDACIDTTYASPETALAAPIDTGVLADVEKVTIPLREKVRTILLVGIGGSDLGTRALYDALHGHTAQYSGAHTPQLLSFATVEPRVLVTMRDLLTTHTSAEEIVLVVISKSGGTAETIANANVLFDMLRERFGDAAAQAQTIVISDPDSPLTTAAREKNMHTLSLPNAVGGRYSVFTSVGLTPLALAGIDVRAFAAGAMTGTHEALTEQGTDAATLAAFLYEGYQQGLHLHELFMWHPELETLGKWYRQLLAESIGKEHANGSRVGIMPTVALGSIDLHSLGQLIFGGPKDRFTTFVAAPSCWNNTPTLTADSPFTISMLEGKSTGDVMRAIYEGVQTSYATHDLPYINIEFEAIDAREIGAFMAHHMASVMCLAQLFEVNAFDQPNVESYKIETKRLLGQ